MPLITNTTFTAARALVTDTDALLLADSRISNWWRGDPLDCVASGGLVSQISDRKAAAKHFMRTNAGQSATLPLTGPGGYANLDFGATNPFYNVGDGTAFNTAAIFSVVALFRLGAVGEYLLSKRGTGSSDHMYISSYTSGGRLLAWQVGSAQVATLIADPTQYVFGVFAFDTTRAYSRVNGVTQNSVASTLASPIAANPLWLGTAFNVTPPNSLIYTGRISDVMWLQGTNLLSSANVALLASIERHFVQTYGLPFTPQVG